MCVSLLNMSSIVLSLSGKFGIEMAAVSYPAKRHMKSPWKTFDPAAKRKPDKNLVFFYKAKKLPLRVEVPKHFPGPKFTAIRQASEVIPYW